MFYAGDAVENSWRGWSNVDIKCAQTVPKNLRAALQVSALTVRYPWQPSKNGSAKRARSTAPSCASTAFRSLTEAIDTTTPAGRMMMQMVGSFAEFEREMIRQRTCAGLERARREGRVGGRRPKLSPRQRREVTEMVSSGRKTAAEAARLFGVHPATVSRLIKEQATYRADYVRTKSR